ncbi:MAG: hypothetical protein K2W78_05030 [Xanthobacteraceae bacterium]|nr:hypothetical protein [Xanthobacteraceae bacterium]
MIGKFLLAIALWMATALVASAEDRYCIVKVGNLGKNVLIGRSFHRIPGQPPIFINDDDRYTLIDRRLTSYNQLYPTAFLDQNPDPRASFAFDDHWKIEPWSGRIVASAWTTGSVAVIEPGEHVFRRIGEPRYSYSQPYVLPRTQETVVTQDGKAWVVGKNELEPWKPGDNLMRAGAHGIIGVYDAPSIPAIIAIDIEHRLWGSLDNITWQRLANLDRDAFGKVFDVPDAKLAIFVSLKSVIKISKTKVGFTPLVAETLSSTNANGADRNFAYLPQFGEVLEYTNGTLSDFISHRSLSSFRGSWRKLTSRRFEAIPGGDDPKAAPSAAVGWKVKQLNSLQTALIDGDLGFFVYDGNRMDPVTDGDRTRIGKYPSVYDTPAIGRAFVKTEGGLKELTNTQLRDVPVGLPKSIITVIDWPESKRAAIFTVGKVFIVDADLNVSAILDTSQIDFDSAPTHGTNPATGDLIFTGKQGTYLIIDTVRSGKEACDLHGN